MKKKKAVKKKNKKTKALKKKSKIKGKKALKKVARHTSSSKGKRAGKKIPQKELKKYKNMLLEQKAELLKELMHLKEDALNKSQKEASGDLSGYSFHMADMASDLYETDFLLRLAADERERLYAIDDALKRVDEGGFGFCSICAKAISKKRLRALPQAESCIICQQDKEKKPS